MTKKAEQRRIAIGAVRSEMRRYGEEPSLATADRALVVLDDIARGEPMLIASQWYSDATSNQIKLFRREW